jgi:WD40 repeat protein/energy-coupling factor transporter ATP-binding protein EcfA2
VDPAAGPVQRFASELRKLREEAGGLTYRVMAKRAGYSVTTLSQAAAGERLASLPVVLAFVETCGGDVEEWQERWHAASREVLEEAAAEDDSNAPYPGMSRFETEDQHRFFGRTALVERLAGLVRAHRLVLLFGASGSGKSSLLRAGLVPRLRQEGGCGEVRVLTPGAQPARTHTAWSDGVIIVDQFEEVFALCGDPAQRRDFITALLAAAAAEGGPRVVLAVRADFFGHCTAYRELAAAVQDATLVMSPMSPAELREAIAEPAAGVGLLVERKLVTRIVSEVKDEPGALPLMSHALLQTWRRRSGGILTAAAYEAAGGIRSSIARTAEDLYTALSPAQRERLRQVLLRLVTPGQNAQDTRRPVERAELLTGDDATELLLERLAWARLITLDQERADMAHEALLTAWPRLNGWIEEDRERMRLQRRLTEAAHAWQDHDRDAGGLYRGLRLSIAVEQFGSFDGLTSLEREFLTAGIAARDRERRHRRRRSTAISVLLGLSLVAGLLAWQQSETSRARQREAEARRVAGVAQSLRDSDPLTAMRLSLAAWRLANLPETRSALMAAAGQRPLDVFTDPDGDPKTVRHLSMDGRTMLSIGSRQVATWDVQTHRRTASLPGLRAERNFLGMRNGDAWIMPTRMGDGEFALWDLTTGRRDATALGRAESGFEMGISGRSVIAYDADGPRYRIGVWDTGTRGKLLEISTRRDASVNPSVWTPLEGAAFLHSTQNARAVWDPASPDATLSPDDKLMAVCVPGERLQLWDVAAGRRMDTPWAPELTKRQCDYEHVSFTPDSRRLTVITGENVRMWDIASGREQAAIDHRNLQEIGFSADGTFMVATDGADLLLWRVANPRYPVFRHALSGELATDLRIDPNANWIRYLAGSVTSWPTTVRTLSLGRAATTLWRKEEATEAAFSPDGTTVALAYGLEKPDVVRFRLYDRRTGQRTANLSEVPCPAINRKNPGMSCSAFLAFSSDGQMLAFGGSTSVPVPSLTRLSLWDVTRRRTVGTYELKLGQHVGALALAPDGTSVFMASVPSDGSMIVWDLRRRVVTKTLPDVTGHQITIRPDRRSMVTSFGDVIDLPSVTPARGSQNPGQNSALAFSPDGRYLAVGDETARTVLWDGRVQRRLGVLDPQVATDSGADNRVNALAFSTDGVLAVGNANGSLQLWDVASRQPIGSPLPALGATVKELAFSPDGKTLYAAGEHIPVQRYDLAPSAIVATVCSRTGGGLSPADWEKYFPNDPYQRSCSSRSG